MTYPEHLLLDMDEEEAGVSSESAFGTRDTRTYGRVEHGADGVDVRAEEEELADLLHDLLVVHVDLPSLADDLRYVLGFIYRRGY